MTIQSALIVDDSKLARVTLSKKLAKHGLTVQMAGSAEEAFAVITENCPEIIFMDHLMPDIDGFEATQKIRNMPGMENLPIIMCTGKDHAGYLAEAQAIGANSTLTKPPTEDSLKLILEMEFNHKALQLEEPAIEIPIVEPEPHNKIETVNEEFVGKDDETSHLDEVLIDLGDIDITSSDSIEMDAQISDLVEVNDLPIPDYERDATAEKAITEHRMQENKDDNFPLADTNESLPFEESQVVFEKLSELGLATEAIKQQISQDKEALSQYQKDIEVLIQRIPAPLQMADVREEIDAGQKQQLNTLASKFSVIKQKLTQHEALIKKVVEQNQQVDHHQVLAEIEKVQDHAIASVETMQNKIDQLEKNQRTFKTLSFLSILVALGACGFIVGRLLELI